MELGKIGSSKDEITNHQSPTFLGVPTEIRLEIYKYLVPQGTVDPQYNEKSGLKIFEEDKECLENEVSSAILLVNKQVHREVVSLWFGTAVFPMSINDIDLGFQGHVLQTLQFMDQHNYSLKDLPSSLCLIRRLDLKIHLDRGPILQTATSKIVKILRSQAHSLKECHVWMSVSYNDGFESHRRLCEQANRSTVSFYNWACDRIDQDSRPLLELVDNGVKVYCEDWRQLELYEMSQIFRTLKLLEDMEDAVASAREDTWGAMGLLRKHDG